MKTHDIAIICKSCQNQWMLQIPLSGNKIEAFASVCDCGALIIGNYNYDFHQTITNSFEIDEIMIKRIYLTNGHFDILNLSKGEIASLPSLTVE